MTIGRSACRRSSCCSAGWSFACVHRVAPRVIGEPGIITGWAEHMASGGFPELLARWSASPTGWH